MKFFSNDYVPYRWLWKFLFINLDGYITMSFYHDYEHHTFTVTVWGWRHKHKLPKASDDNEGRAA